ncbi:hypothetical protein, partial [Gluconacetobacter sacchari]|uniref:hypothetical protein n=1 Tax=Gluconacetobacter sacchari TaxID=92759 RepID=UPI0022319573
LHQPGCIPKAGDLIPIALHFCGESPVCTYPDSSSLVIDGLDCRGFLREAPYYEGQPEPTPLLSCHAAKI